MIEEETMNDSRKICGALDNALNNEASKNEFSAGSILLSLATFTISALDTIANEPAFIEKFGDKALHKVIIDYHNIFNGILEVVEEKRGRKPE